MAEMISRESIANKKSASHFSPLAEGNKALREKRFASAMAFYIQALQETPALCKIIDFNVALANQRYRKKPIAADQPRVAVIDWDPAYNATGRVYTLAQVYRTIGDVVIISCLSPKNGEELYEPIWGTTIPVHTFLVEDKDRFLDQSVQYVADHPYDIVHLSKPRPTNIFFGILYKLLWSAKVLVDIDDEELALVGADNHRNINDCLKTKDNLTPLKNLNGTDWRLIAVSLVKEFDGITVSSPALQNRYGGEIIPHGQEEKLNQPTIELRCKKSEKYGINSLIANAVISDDLKKLFVHFFGNPIFAGLTALMGMHQQRPIEGNRFASVQKVSSNSIPNLSVKRRKLPITVLVITWDVGHNPLGRSYMLAEVLDRVALNVVLVGFQFPRFGHDVWEPVRDAKLPVISLPGSNFPEFLFSLDAIAERIKPDVVIACKPRLPSVHLGLLIKQRCGCPLIVDIDDHELSFFKTQSELSLEALEEMPPANAAVEVEPYGELWTRLTQNLCKLADECLTSNVALHREFGGTMVPHVRDEAAFDPDLYDRDAMRHKYGVPLESKVVLFFGTPRHHKGIDALARGIEEVNVEHFYLVIVGTPPDRSVTSKLDSIAPGRIIYIPNQPFTAIPEILSIADVVCLPQDEDNAISQYQLPAKAIDAVAMGVPLLVTHTPPLMQLVEDGVAMPVAKDAIAAELKNIACGKPGLDRWRDKVRSRFLARYSYSAAAKQLHEILQRVVHRRGNGQASEVERFLTAQKRALGLPDRLPVKPRKPGVDIALFWKQNDTGLYGRRHDMVIKYLASRKDVRKVLVFDAPISELDLVKLRDRGGEPTQDRWIYVLTYEKLLGKHDTEKISYNVFVHPPGKFRTVDSSCQKPHLLEAYIPYLKEVFDRENVQVNEAIFWIYPKNYFAPALIEQFKPAKVVVDIVDDHRTWPNTSEAEKIRLTENYRETLALADMVFTNCKSIKNSLNKFHPGIRLIPNGCDTSPPTVAPKDSLEFNSFCAWPGKTIGYIGNLESKIDIELIDQLAQRFSDCQIALIGSTHANPKVLQLKRHPNVCMPGVVPYREAGAWVSRFDVGLVPHRNIEQTRNMNPLKLFVYLSLNVPVVSTEIDNIERHSEMVRVAANHEEFITEVATILTRGRPPRDTAARYVTANSWVTRLSLHVDELMIKNLDLPKCCQSLMA